METSLLFLLIPAIFFCGMIGFGTLALQAPGLIAARWAAAGFGIAILSASIDAMRGRWPEDVVVFSVPLHWAALAALMQAFILRRTTRSDAAAVFMLLSVASIANLMVARVHYLPDARTAIVNVVAILLTLHALVRLRGPHRELLDWIVTGFIAAVGLSYAIRLALFYGAGAAGDFGTLATWSHYKIVAYFSASIMALCAALILGVALGSDIVREHVRARAMDSLTGIPNRFAYDRWLRDDEAEGGNSYSGALMFDIDHFKAVNDTHGHAGGDAALRAVAQTLVDVLGRYGHVARIGGEEFAMLVDRRCPLPPAILAESARTAVLAIALDTPWDAVQLSISVGYAARSKDQSASKTLRQADLALYQAKLTGRNRSVAAEPAPSATIKRVA